MINTLEIRYLYWSQETLYTSELSTYMYLGCVQISIHTTCTRNTTVFINFDKAFNLTQNTVYQGSLTQLDACLFTNYNELDRSRASRRVQNELFFTTKFERNLKNLADNFTSNINDYHLLLQSSQD